MSGAAAFKMGRGSQVPLSTPAHEVMANLKLALPQVGGAVFSSVVLDQSRRHVSPSKSRLRMLHRSGDVTVIPTQTITGTPA